MAERGDEEDLLVGLSKLVTKTMISQLKSGEVSPAELRNILTHLKHNDVSYSMMSHGEEGPKLVALLDDIEIGPNTHIQEAM